MALPPRPVQTIDTISVKVEQVDVFTESKTKDDVSVSVTTVISYAVDPDNVEPAYFALTNPRSIMIAVCEDEVRSEVPRMTLDDLYEHKQDMSKAVQVRLQDEMNAYGFKIVQVLLTSLEPNARVAAAMNSINTNQRGREAAVFAAEGHKALRIKRAEAECDAQGLQGKGIALQTVAIMEGFADAVTEMKSEVDLDAPDVVHMMLLTQYLDTVKEFAYHRNTTIVVDDSNDAVSNIEHQIKDGFVKAAAMSESNPAAVQKAIEAHHLEILKEREEAEAARKKAEEDAVRRAALEAEEAAIQRDRMLREQGQVSQGFHRAASMRENLFPVPPGVAGMTAPPPPPPRPDPPPPGLP